MKANSTLNGHVKSESPSFNQGAFHSNCKLRTLHEIVWHAEKAIVIIYTSRNLLTPNFLY